MASPAAQPPSWLPSFLQNLTQPKSTESSAPNERTSLLSKTPDVSINSASSSSSETSADPAPWHKPVLDEFFLLLKMTLPVVLAYALQNSLQTISVLVVGRISPEHLAAAAFSYMFAMATGWLIALGGTTALDTLCSSSFTGSSNPHELGILLQRAFIVLGGMYLPVCVLWWYSEAVFLVLGQEPGISRDSAQFLRYLIPGGLGYIYFEAGKKFLQAQGLMRAGTYVLMITAPLSLGLNYLFVYELGFGLVGAPIGTGITYWVSFALLMGYARFVAGWEAWGGWDRSAFRNMGMFARLAGMGVIMVGTEWWAFEIVALAAGKLGTVPLAAQSVIMTTDQVLNTIPFGMSVAASTRVGNLLGARDGKGAARAANTAAWLSIFCGTVVLVVMISVKDNFAKIFNDDPAVVALTAKIIPYVALFQIADGLVGSCGGSLRGMGRQHIGAAVNSVSYYAGALPLGIHLAFNGWGLEGLWIGQCIALYLVGFIEWAIVAFSDWNLQVRKAFERMDEGTQIEAGGLLADDET